MRILHVGTDKEFTAYMVEKFERFAPGENTLLTLMDHPAPQPRHTVAGVPTEVIRENWSPGAVTSDMEHALGMAKQADVVVAHSLRPSSAYIALQLPDVIVSWMGWGFDYYRESRRYEEYAGPLTLQVMQALNPAAFQGNPMSEREQVEEALFQAAVANIDYFSAPIPSDLGVMVKEFPGFRGEYRQVPYADSQTTLEPGGVEATGENIQVGNSAAWTGNHLEVFALLAEQDLAGRKVIVPLTYGDTRYRSVVMDVGNKLLGSHFQPLIDHMPLTDYLSLIASCNVKVFNHKRQQAMGNILAAMVQGSHLYMHAESPATQWLMDAGAEILATEALRDGLPSGAVDVEVNKRNSDVVDAHWSTEHVDELIKGFVTELRDRIGEAG